MVGLDIVNSTNIVEEETFVDTGGPADLYTMLN